MRWNLERRAAENANFDEKAGQSHARSADSRALGRSEGRGEHQTDSFMAAQQRLLACCDSLRRALDDIEQSIEAPELPRRENFQTGGPLPGTFQQSHADSEPDAPASNVTMRDMTGFLLSKEGDRFLNLLRRMIREEIDKSRQDKPPEPQGALRPGRMAQDIGVQDIGAADVEGLRALVRRRMKKD